MQLVIVSMLPKNYGRTATALEANEVTVQLANGPLI